VPVDPPIQGMLSMLAAMQRPSLAAGTPEVARRAFRMLTVDLRPAGTIVPVAAVEDLEVPGAAGPLPARLYRPEAEGELATIVFFHGGGFVIGDIDTHDNQCRALCREAEAVVLSVGYRLAPEHPFPAAPDDCFAATRWACEHVADLGGDAGRVAVAGDSAGGNLAAVVAQMIVGAHRAEPGASAGTRDAGGRPLAAQLLLYPGTDFEGGYPSESENAEGFFLTRADMEWFRSQYLAGADPSDPRLSPLRAPDLSGLPPAVVVTAEFDPLRDQGDAYARALDEAGVHVVTRSYGGLIHGFFDLGALSPAAAEAAREVCADLRGLLKRPALAGS
jgi:acetyl esterase